MVKIALLDDELYILEKLELLLQQCYCSEEISVDKFLTYEEIMASEIEEYDVFFLDIEMPGKDGFEVGEEIKKMNPDCCIMMATGNTDRYKDGFKLGVFRYITKPWDFDEIQEAVTSFYDVFCKNKRISAYKDRVEYNLKLADIEYFEAYNGYVQIYSRGDVYRKDDTLANCQSILDESFVKISRQYIINLKYVLNIENEIMFLENAQFPISRTRRKKIIKAFYDYKLR